MKIEIHEEKNCAWCEINGSFIYGKTASEVQSALDNLAKLSVGDKTMKMTRQEANRKILEIIAKVVEAEPDWRFHQILQNLGIEERGGRDQWFDESEETYSNMTLWNYNPNG